MRKGCHLETYEKILWRNGLELICGIDEAGRGPLAGPVTAAAVILPPNTRRNGIADSKTLTPGKREELAEEIRCKAVAWAVASVDHETIDRINILQASLLAMRKAYEKLSTRCEILLLDGNHLIPDIAIEQKAIVRGDSLAVTIGAASILAKVERDRIMDQYHVQFPQYNFASNKGYPTREHRCAIHLYGPCEIHRRSFRLLPDGVVQGALPLEG